MKRAGEIVSIQEQAPVTYYVNGHKIAKNIVDFKCEMPDGTNWYVEAKGAETARYTILKQLAIAMLDGIDPGSRYSLVKGRVGNLVWKELKLVRV